MITLKIDFKNCSSIENIESDGEIAIGKRSEFPYWYNDSDTCYDRKVIDEVLKPFCNVEELTKKIRWWRKHPSKYVYLTSVTKLKLWQRIWIDKICKFIRK